MNNVWYAGLQTGPVRELTLMMKTWYNPCIICQYTLNRTDRPTNETLSSQMYLLFVFSSYCIESMNCNKVEAIKLALYMNPISSENTVQPMYYLPVYTQQNR